MELFPADFLKQLEGLHLLARQISRGRSRAERRSVKRGSGLEFADYRAFSPGDDIRAIDWRVFARNRHLLLKLFEEEEDLYVHLLLDCTESMAWGTPAKHDPARQLAAGLSYLALANLDRAGVTPLGPAESESKLPPPWAPSRGRARFLRLLRYLEGCNTLRGRSEMAGSVGRWLATRPRRGLVLWITDGWGETPDDLFLALDRLRYARHEVGLIQIRHADEGQAGELGEFAHEEVETGETRVLIVDRSAAKAYADAVSEYDARLDDYCRRHGIARLRADAGDSAIEVLRRALLSGGFVR